MDHHDIELEFQGNQNEENEMDAEIVEPFKISKKGLDKLMEKYLNRQLDEELNFIESKGGIQFFESGLKTNFKEGINDDDAMSLVRKRAFDSNEQEPEEPLSFCEFFKEGFGDRIIQILCVAAVVEIALNVGFGDPEERHIGI